MMSDLRRPVLAGRRDYARKFADVPFWEPYVHEVMRRHSLSAAGVAVGSGGTFPTFLVGAYVVKLFPKRFDGGECFLIERSLHTSLLDHPEIPAPRHVAHGHLFQNGWRWPHLVTTRLDGTPWHDAGISAHARQAVAYQLGATMRRVHDLGCPDESVWRRDLVAELRATCSDRIRRRGTLPLRLLDQIDDYLATPLANRRLLHGDLHADHIFVDGARLVGVIDWGDALCGDPHYELPALFFGTFGTSTALLHAFLNGYDWQLTSDFAHRAMSMTLLHEFNPLGAHLPPLGDIDSVHDLAEKLWQL
jgi:hygromycin-B 7''-O-kinase